MENSPATYDPVAKALHWLVFILLTIEFVVAWTMPHIKRGEAPTDMVNFHLSFGILVFVVILLRTLWRFTHHVPAPVETTSKWDRMMAHAMHHSLYAALVIMPFVGWMWASAKGWTVSFFGIIPLPALVAPGSTIGRAAGQVHSLLGVIIVTMVVLHAAAALYHHFVLKNETLKRMLPD